MGRALTVYTNDRSVIFNDEDDNEHTALLKSEGQLQVSVDGEIVGVFNIDCWSHFTITKHPETEDDE